ncbi:hypothetical protein [Acaryochloris sp. IP29b_bin.148]|uniref:hypothetical protein n=1 Tax=Acaryochloris sp. IP29b_bin.148 TaxID=2969218 RepID=UPI002619168E|nr:hypothetical protein [Acaryochloris sp. IP29b_bin.148]
MSQLQPMAQKIPLLGAAFKNRLILYASCIGDTLGMALGFAYVLGGNLHSPIRPLLAPIARVLGWLLVDLPGDSIAFFTCQPDAQSCVGGWGYIYAFTIGFPLFTIAMIIVPGTLGACLFGSMGCLFLKISARPKS